MTQQPDDSEESELSRRAVELINQERQSRGLNPLSVDVTLTNLARQHCRDIVDATGPTENSPSRGSLIDTIFEDVDVAEAAADVFLTDAIDVVASSKHVQENFNVLGVAVARRDSLTVPRLWVTVIYGSL
ncbi:MAG: CAP domain-containing protein [Myxococcota bacterium]